MFIGGAIVFWNSCGGLFENWVSSLRKKPNRIISVKSSSEQEREEC